MEIFDKDGMTFRKDERGNFLINPSEKKLAQIRNSDTRNIELNESLGFVPGNGSIFFLKNFDFIEGLSIICNKKIDLKAIAYLPNLRILNLPNEYDTPIDFEKINKLIWCQIAWNKKNKNFDKLKHLETLMLLNYKNVDFLEFSNLTSLKKLSIIQSTIAELSGINRLQSLEFLDLSYLKNLRSLEGIQFSGNLTRLELENTPKIDNVEWLRGLKNIETLFLHDLREIESLSPLKDLKHLEYIYISGNTNILDGDMAPMLGRKDASIGTRKHYSHKSEEIDRINGTVRPKQTRDY